MIPANTPDRTHRIVPIGVVPLPTGKIGAQIYPRLSRVAATGTAPTNDPFITMLQVHIECDTPGSRETAAK